MRRLTLPLLFLVFTLAVSAPTLRGQEQPAPAAPKAPVAAVNLNTATNAQLEALPGIGVYTAARIVEYREKNGGFKKTEDLMNVPGIGEKSFLKLKPLVTVTPPKADKAGAQQ